jgi:hypothetical protein
MSNFLKKYVIGITAIISTTIVSYKLGKTVGQLDGFNEGSKVAEKSEPSEPLKQFSEPMHSVFITVCIERGDTYEQCSCIESKVYMLEADAKAGRDMTFAYEAARLECNKGPLL